MKFTIATTALLTAASESTAATAAASASGNNDLPSFLQQPQHRDSNSNNNNNKPRKLAASLSSMQGQYIGVVDNNNNNKNNKKKQQQSLDVAQQLLSNSRKNRKNNAASSNTPTTATAGTNNANNNNGAKKIHEWAQKQRLFHLTNLIRQEDEYVEECEPGFDDYDDYVVVDVGVLSCGQGRYCLDVDSLSELLLQQQQQQDDTKLLLPSTSLGGICVDAPTDRDMVHIDTVHRHLQGGIISDESDGSGGLNTTIVQDIYDLCYGNVTAEYSFITCECSGVDIAAYTGTLSCTYDTLCGELANICQENTTVCYGLTYELSLTAQYTGSGTVCYEFTQPEPFNYCYGAVYSGAPDPTSCTLSFYGTECTSCGFTTVENEPGVPTDCIVFDCENTPLGLSATLCDYNIVELVVADYLLYGSLPCPDGCNLCGDGGYMTNPYTNITLPTGEAYACGLLDIAAQAGYFAGFQPDLCQLLPSLVDVPCGCVAGEVDANATFAPTGAQATISPAATPTVAPVAIGVPTTGTSSPDAGGTTAPPFGPQPTDAPAPSTASSIVTAYYGLATTIGIVGWFIQSVMAA